MTMILLVEDNQDDIALALRAFRKHEPAREIHVAEDGSAALEFLLGKDWNSFWARMVSRPPTPCLASSFSISSSPA
jgi:hypothetical protein